MHQKSAHSVFVVLLVVSLLAVSIQAYPSWRANRQKRVSDQRLAELQTLLALARLKGKMSVSAKYTGFVDPAKIGRKKRSQDNFGDYTITEDRMDYEMPSDGDRDVVILQSQEDDDTTEDVWLDQRRTSKQVG